MKMKVGFQELKEVEVVEISSSSKCVKLKTRKRKVITIPLDLKLLRKISVGDILTLSFLVTEKGCIIQKLFRVEEVYNRAKEEARDILRRGGIYT